MNVEVVQRRLWEQSREHKRGRETAGTLFEEDPCKLRIRNLYDLMHNPVWLREACVRVLSRSRGKVAGVDKETVSKFEESLEYKLEKLRLELKRGTYRPQPARRVWIPKSNGKKRALGIPCLRDKIVQEAMRMALEPIYEVEFHPSSCGFRPHRSAHHAITRCQALIRAGFTWVIEGDVRACFDEIAHDSILRNLREKVADKKLLALVGMFLKAGVVVDGVREPTEKGVPQGGVLSPLLANIVLNRLDWFLHGKGDYRDHGQRKRKYGKPNIRFVRYADDWCVFITRDNKGSAERLRGEIRDFLRAEAGLELSEEKTHITHVRDGFDFLGFRISRGIGKGGKEVAKIKVGEQAGKDIRRRLDEALRFRSGQESLTLRVNRASKLITGWSNYFCLAHNIARVSAKLDHYAFWSAVKAACRKFDISTAKCMKRHYRHSRFVVDEDCKLARFSTVKMKMWQVKPKEYVPGGGEYLEDHECDADYLFRESKLRRGSLDLRWDVLKRDGHRCRHCGTSVTNATARIDHIVPVKRFARFSQAHTLDNLQTLCIDCHKQKTRGERTV